MAAVYKGLFLQLGIDGKAMLSEFEQIDGQLKKTQSELNTLQKSLKIEFDGTKFKRAQELAQRAVQESKEKVDLLKRQLQKRTSRVLVKALKVIKIWSGSLRKLNLPHKKPIRS